MSILQWNCRGYAANFEELKILLLQHNPDVVCLQETFHGPNTPSPPRRYNTIAAEPVTEYVQGTRPSRGVITLINNCIPYHVVPLNTNLEAVAIQIHKSQPITICNIYISPHERVMGREFIDLVDQLPSPFIIVGDLNAHHPLWGAETTNPHGQVIEDAMTNTDACILNTREYTHFHVQTGTTSCIDLCLLSSRLLLTYEWRRIDDLCGSDHYPIVIKETGDAPIQLKRRFLIHKADWKTFTALTNVNYEELKEKEINEMTESFTNIIYAAAINSIPLSSNIHRPHPVPWWNEHCRLTHQERKVALRRYKRTKSIHDKIELNRTSAQARFAKKRARKLYWKNFVSSITTDTPISKYGNVYAK